MMVGRHLWVLLIATLGCGGTPQTSEPTTTPGESAVDPEAELETHREENEAAEPGAPARPASPEAELETHRAEYATTEAAPARPASPEAELPASGGTPAHRGDVDAAGTQEAEDRQPSGVRSCYTDALRTQPDLAGKLTLTITIARKGVVTDVRVDQDTLGSTSMLTCVRAKIIATWRFGVQDDRAQRTFSLVFAPD